MKVWLRTWLSRTEFWLVNMEKTTKMQLMARVKHLFLLKYSLIILILILDILQTIFLQLLDHVDPRRKHLCIQRSKKMNCGAKLTIQHLMLFPQYQVGVWYVPVSWKRNNCSFQFWIYRQDSKILYSNQFIHIKYWP